MAPSVLDLLPASYRTSYGAGSVLQRKMTRTSGGGVSRGDHGVNNMAIIKG
jgi:hypothetical protein